MSSMGIMQPKPLVQLVFLVRLLGVSGIGPQAIDADARIGRA
jgi:hypothetical protein